jgi:hypothetical protein
VFNVAHSNMNRLIEKVVAWTVPFSNHIIKWGSYQDRYAARQRCPWEIPEELSRATIIGDTTPLAVIHRRGDVPTGNMGMLTLPYKSWGNRFLNTKRLHSLDCY